MGRMKNRAIDAQNAIVYCADCDQPMCRLSQIETFGECPCQKTIKAGYTCLDFTHWIDNQGGLILLPVLIGLAAACLLGLIW